MERWSAGRATKGSRAGLRTQFFLNGPPTDLSALGFAATVEDLNDRDVIVGGQYRMDLGTGAVTQLGVPGPTGGLSFNFTRAYAVNDGLQTVAAASVATSTSSRWLTFIHDDAAGWRQLNPNVVPSPFVGFYDNNDRGDVSASGGVLFLAENQLVGGYDGLLAPSSQHWDTSLGFIADDRRVFTVAQDTSTGTFALVLLVPQDPGVRYCAPAVPTSTGAPATIRAEGGTYAAANSLLLVAEGVPANAFGYFLNSSATALVPGAGGSQGTLCLGGQVGRYSTSVLHSGPSGTFTLHPDLTATPTPLGLVSVAAGETWHFQAWFRDANPNPTSNFTDALSVTFD